MVKQDRAQRIAARIREELSEILLTESADPRISGVSVTDVTVDRELDYANVFVSALEGSERSKEILAGLEHAQGYLRSELARRIDLRAFPRLRFRWDPTFENAERIERLLASLHSEEAQKEQGEPRSDEESAIEDGENEADE